MRWTARLAACLLTALLALFTLGSAAQGSGGAAGASGGGDGTVATTDTVGSTRSADLSLDQLRQQYAQIPKTVDSTEEVRQVLGQLRDIGAQVDRFVAARTGELNDLNSRLGELGNPPAAGMPPEAAGVTRQRATLLRERNALDADIRLAKLLAVDAQQRGADLLNQQRAQFTAQLFERAPSPLGREFWADLQDAWPDDSAKLQQLGDELRQDAARADQPAQSNALLASLLAALLLAVLGTLAAERALVRVVQRVLPVGRLRRSLLAVGIVLAHVVMVGTAAQWVFSALDARGVLGEQTRPLVRSALQFCVFLAFVVGLGRAQLSNARPSWRLLPISDALARRQAPFPWLLALVAMLVAGPAAIVTAIDASFAAVVTIHVLAVLLISGLVVPILNGLRVPEEGPVRGEAAPEGSEAIERPLWVNLLIGGAALVLVAIWVLLALGYVALASFLAGQLVWTGIVLSAAYVLFAFADDLFMALVSSRSHTGQRLQQRFGVAPRTLDQAAVVLSALARVALFFYTVIALLAPFGTGPDEVLQRSGQLGSGVRIGEFQIVPEAILSAAAVLVLGFIALRVFKRWLERRYLPNTAIEPAMRSSLTTLLGYAGGIVVVAFALSALGIGVERIAWIASALSVGIGFGLQAIVQNFISGLILLAERPVKVGDWVVLGSIEGDVRRINVRATEIQLGDRSTVIVPNSEFITKAVRNMTLSGAEGRVLIRLPMPLTTDAPRVRDLMLQAAREHPAVLAKPPPALTLEGIEQGLLIFQLIAYVESPRQAGGVRSDLMFAMLTRLSDAGLALAPAPVAWPPGVALVAGLPPVATAPPPGPLGG